MASGRRGEWRRRLDAARFAEDLGLAPDAWQAGVLRWEGKRLALNCARQTGKSTIAAALALHRAVRPMLATALGLACWEEGGWGESVVIPPVDWIAEADRGGW